MNPFLKRGRWCGDVGVFLRRKRKDMREMLCDSNNQMVHCEGWINGVPGKGGNGKASLWY